VFGILGALMIVMNVGNEMAARKMSAKMETMQKQFEDMGKQLEQSGEMTPEQAGKAMGDFLKGFNEATKDMDDSVAKE
jgi:polyhydroxyalkanoate synthesis regulator phasin